MSRASERKREARNMEIQGSVVTDTRQVTNRASYAIANGFREGQRSKQKDEGVVVSFTVELIAGARKMVTQPTKNLVYSPIRIFYILMN